MKYKEINILNVFMCFAVVMIHLTSSMVSQLDKSTIWYPLFFCINKFLTFAVPAFIFLSGFKLFSKYKDTELSIKKFYMGRIKKIVLPYILSYIIYSLYFYKHELVTLEELPKGLFLGTLVSHFYYIIIALQLYFLFPLIYKLFNKYPRITLAFSLLITILLNQFISFDYSDRFFATYILYFVLGMFIAKNHDKNISFKKIVLLLSCFVVVAIVHISLSEIMSLGTYWYRPAGAVQVIYSCLAVLSFMVLAKEIHSSFIEKIVSFVNPHTFFIFLYHVLVIYFVNYTLLATQNVSLKENFLVNTVVMLFFIVISCLIRNKLITKKGRQIGALNFIFYSQRIYLSYDLFLANSQHQNHEVLLSNHM